MSIYKSKNIQSLGDLVNEIKSRLNESSDTASFPWCRGHADESWDLIPKVQRKPFKNDNELFNRERKITNAFQLRAGILPTSTPKPKMKEYAHWLTLMQHYGLSTRLLDWSRSPLIALYFAVCEKDVKKDGCIWVLNPGKLNLLEELKQSDSKNNRKDEILYNIEHEKIEYMIQAAFENCKLSIGQNAHTPEVAACYPTEADFRVYNQLSTFTIHNTSKKLVDTYGEDKSVLEKLIVPKENKRGLLRELAACGITQYHVFPDFDNLAKNLMNYYDHSF